jgi:ankyrin repeat protein
VTGPRLFLAGLLGLLAAGGLLAAACSDVAPPAPAPTTTPTPSAAGEGAVNRALGLGEARNPAPFTIEHRLLDAVSRDDRPTIERALALGASVRAKDDLGRSTLFLAVMDAHDLELVRWLHDKGVPVDEADVSKRTPLSFAADDGDVPIVRYLVENGAAVDSRDFQQRTPLAHAVGAGHDDVVAFLADHGADLNARDQFGDTPLIVACAKGNATTAALLIARGADATLTDQEGRTAKERSAPEAAPCLRLPK